MREIHRTNCQIAVERIAKLQSEAIIIKKLESLLRVLSALFLLEVNSSCNRENYLDLHMLLSNSSKPVHFVILRIYKRWWPNNKLKDFLRFYCYLNAWFSNVSLHNFGLFHKLFVLYIYYTETKIINISLKICRIARKIYCNLFQRHFEMEIFDET